MMIETKKDENQKGSKEAMRLAEIIKKLENEYPDVKTTKGNNLEGIKKAIIGKEDWNCELIKSQIRLNGETKNCLNVNKAKTGTIIIMVSAILDSEIKAEKEKAWKEYCEKFPIEFQKMEVEFEKLQNKIERANDTHDFEDFFHLQQKAKELMEKMKSEYPKAFELRKQENAELRRWWKEYHLLMAGNPDNR